MLASVQIRGFQLIRLHFDSRIPQVDRVTVDTMRREYDTTLPDIPAGSMPKVALLFLTKGQMPLQKIWEKFFHSKEAADHPAETAWQNFFSIYVHAPREYLADKYWRGTVFAGHILKNPIKVVWGQHSMIDAERLLLRAALADPLNSHFVILSDTTIPLYSAPLVYAQTILDSKSRINACANNSDPYDQYRRNMYRWQRQLEVLAGVTADLWRKSSQWMTLIRSHAELVAYEEQVNKAFAKECYVEYDKKTGDTIRFCVSDEHYIPTLLAFKGLESQCACDGESTRAVWLGNYPHPREFGPDEATWGILTFGLRDGWACNHAGVVPNATKMLLDVASKNKITAGGAAREALLEAGSDPMPARCPLFARKIAPEGVREWSDLLSTVL